MKYYQYIAFKQYIHKHNKAITLKENIKILGQKKHENLKRCLVIAEMKDFEFKIQWI